MTHSESKITYRLKDRQLHKTMSFLNVNFEEELGRGFKNAMDNSETYASVTCFASTRCTRQSPKDWDENTKRAMGCRATQYTYFFNVNEIVREEEPNAQK